MFFPFRHERPNEYQINNWFAGLHINSDCRRIETALIGLEGCQADSPVILQKNMSFDLPIDISSAFEAIQRRFMEEPRRLTQWSMLTSDSRTETNQTTQQSVDDENSFSRGEKHFQSEVKVNTATKNVVFPDVDNLLREMETLKIMLTSVAEEAIEELFAHSGIARENVILLTVTDPGIQVDTIWGITQRELCDSASLAVKTGLNILNALPDKDVAVSGQGRPLYPFPYWIYLNHSEQNRLLIDLGQTARMIYIPNSKGDSPWNNVVCSAEIPCGNMINFFTEQISRGKSLIDVGGRLSVQGRCIPELVQQWNQIFLQIEKMNSIDYSSLFLSPNNTIYPFLYQIDQLVQKNQWSLSDMLCSCVHWIAETLVRQIKTSSFSSDSFNIIITGKAKQNGLLFNRLSMLLHPQRIELLESLQIPEESFDAMAAAMLGVLFQCQMDMNLPHLTQAKQAVVLGKLTPGGKTGSK